MKLSGAERASGYSSNRGLGKGRKMDKSKMLLRFFFYLAIIWAGYLIYCHFVMDIVFSRIYDGNNDLMYRYTERSILIFMITLGICIAEMGISKKLTEFFVFILAAMYTIIVGMCLCRSAVVAPEFVFNPVTSILNLKANSNLSHMGFMVLGMAPFGILMRKAELKKVVAVTVVAGMAFETAQTLLLRGSFAVLDILLYLIGVTGGYYAGRLWLRKRSSAIYE